MKLELKKLYLFLFLGVLLLGIVFAQTIITGGEIIAIQGAESVPFPVFLNNNESVAGFQVEIDYPLYLSFKGLVETSRMPNATIIINNETLGILKIAVLDRDGIEPGNEEIFNLIFNVDESAVPGEYDIGLSEFIMADIETTILSTEVNNGTFAIVEPYNLTFLPPINLFENFSLQDGATLPFKFKIENVTSFVLDDSVKIRVFNLSLGIDKTYNASGEGDAFIRMDETEEQYVANIHTNQLGMPLGSYDIVVSFDNFQKEEIGFELIQNGHGKGKQK